MNPTRKTPPSPERVERLRAALARRQPDLTVVLEGVRDIHNVNGILRTCDGAGVFEVHLLYTNGVFPNFHQVGRRSSMGARKWVEKRLHDNTATCFGTLRREGFRILASRLDDEAKELGEVDFTGPTAIVLGNEHDGVSPEAASFADETFRIPMLGVAQSLNVSVAAGIALYEGVRQRTAKGLYDTSRLDPDVFERMLEQWKAL